MSVSVSFDELIHPSTRLSIMALLAAADWADFSFVRDTLDLSDSALSKQLSTLEGAGYLRIDGEPAAAASTAGRRRVQRLTTKELDNGAVFSTAGISGIADRLGAC